MFISKDNRLNKAHIKYLERRCYSLAREVARMLRIEHFTKTYGTKTAVDDLSLHIAPGEIFGFIGHNGAGKTTTLKACCGILQFTKGEIFVAGHSIRKEPLACKRELAYIPDNPDLYDFLTGLQYLNFVADIYPACPRRTAPHASGNSGELLGMTDDLAQPISDCSHGMKQKVTLISALLHNPKPRFYRRLNKRVSKLTGIQEARLKAEGIPFPEAMEQFRAWCGEDVAFLTWGFDDIAILQENLALFQLPADWTRRWYNAQMMFNAQTDGSSSRKP